METVQICLLMVGLATVVAVSARAISVPAPSLLVVVGVLIGLIPGIPPVHIEPEIISLVVLPPLLYAAGEELAWRDLRRVWRPVAVLAVGLVIASAAAVAVVAHAVTPMPWNEAFILGAVLASTDPVAVTALGRRLALPPAVQALVQAESLFNDATSLILFRLAVSAAVASAAIGIGGTALEFAVLAGGGVAIGVAVATVAALIRRSTVDPVVETVISLVTPYGAFVLAERIHASGVTAVVVASVIMGVVSPRLTTPGTRLQMHAVHATTVFVLESVVFGLIGLVLPGLVREEQRGWILPAFAIAGAMLLVRVAWVYPLAGMRHWRALGARRRSWQVPAVVSWAGARGVVPLAAALSIPFVDEAGAAVPYRSLILVLAIGVIVISLVVQGFTLAPLVRRAEVAVPAEQTRDDYVRAWRRLTAAALAYLDEVQASAGYRDEVLDQARRSVRAGSEMATADSDDPGQEYRRVRRAVISRQEGELRRMYRAGEVSEHARRTVQRQLDLQAERFEQLP